MAELKTSVNIAVNVTGKEQIDTLKGSVVGLGNADNGVKEVGKDIAAIGDAAKSAEQKASPANKNIKSGIASISDQLDFAKNAYLAFIGATQAAAALKGIAETADSFKGISARLQLATADAASFNAAFDHISTIANSTGSSLESTATLFTRLTAATKALGLSQSDVASVTETINQAFAVSGASASEASNSIRQLAQGLASGALRGDEFNSVMENAPRLSEALATSLGTTTGGLRAMAEAGELTSEKIVGALRGQADVIGAEFSKIPLTIGRSVQAVENEWLKFIGELDQSKGISDSVANAISGLANHLDFLGNALINTGQAYLGFKAYNIAAEFLSIKNAVQGSTAAHLANAAAVEGAAVSVGRLGKALSLLKGFSLAFLITNIKDIGEYLGEGIAKLQGYGKATKDAELKIAAMEEAAARLKKEQEELTKKTQAATDAFWGLSAQSKAIITDFDELKQKGKTTTEAIEGIGKSLQLGDVEGIKSASAALDKLKADGKITGEQLKAALQAGLDGKDLQAFEVEARLAFDNTEQGARRLAAALDAQLGAALKRTGLDAGALKNGINDAATAAINDFYVLKDNIDAVKASGVEVGIALSAGLNQAEKAATTAKAAEAVKDEWERLGKAGLITGQQLADGLDKAQKKIDELTPGINTLNEAFKVLGLKSPAELKKTEEAAREAFNTIQAGSGSSAQSVELVNAAFKKYADAAIAANGGVATDALKVEAAFRGIELSAGNAGVSIQNHMAGGQAAIASLGTEADLSKSKIEGMADAANKTSSKGVDGPYIQASKDIDFAQNLYQKGASVEEKELAEKYVSELFKRQAATLLTGNLGSASNAERLQQQAINTAVDQALAAARTELKTGSAVDLGTSVNDLIAQSLAKSPIRSVNDIQSRVKQAGNAALESFTVNIHLGKNKTAINVASKNDAENLAGLFSILEQHATM